jgi:flavin-binding protein dodecin
VHVIPTSSDPIEAALAEAFKRASDAGDWATVRVLVAELEARRKARESSGNVVRIDAPRRRR